MAARSDAGAAWEANGVQARVRLVTAGAPRVFNSWNEGEGTLENSAKSVQRDLIVDGVGTDAAQNGYCEEPPSAAGKICTQRWVNKAQRLSLSIGWRTMTTP